MGAKKSSKNFQNLINAEETTQTLTEPPPSPPPSAPHSSPPCAALGTHIYRCKSLPFRSGKEQEEGYSYRVLKRLKLN